MKLNRMLRRRRRHPAAEFASENAMLLLAGVAAGAALVYLTSGRGKRHRRVAVDKTVSAVRTSAGAVGSTARNLRDRTRGLLPASGRAGNGSASARPQPASAVH